MPFFFLFIFSFFLFFIFHFPFFFMPVFDGARLPFWTLNYLQVFSVPNTGRAREDPTLAMQLLQVWSRETNKKRRGPFSFFVVVVEGGPAEERVLYRR